MSGVHKDLISEFIDVGGTETHILKFGNLHNSDARKQAPQYLFLVIPGKYQ